MLRSVICSRQKIDFSEYEEVHLVLPYKIKINSLKLIFDFNPKCCGRALSVVFHGSIGAVSKTVFLNGVGNYAYVLREKENFHIYKIRITSSEHISTEITLTKNESAVPGIADSFSFPFSLN